MKVLHCIKLYMARYYPIAVLFLCYVTFIVQSNAGTRMLEPPTRASLWRYGYNTPANQFDDQTDCGGYKNRYLLNGGKCGVCGDSYDDATPRQHEAGGRVAPNPRPVRAYKKGSYITVVMETTSILFGRFEFRLCQITDSMETPDQSCFDSTLLTILEAESGTQYQIGSRQGIHTLNLRLPDSVTCQHCILQWRHHTGYMTNQESCTSCPGGVVKCHVCKGCGDQVWYVGCTDIAIYEDFQFAPGLLTTAAPSTETTENTSTVSPGGTSKVSNYGVTSADGYCTCPSPDPRDKLINTTPPYSSQLSTPTVEIPDANNSNDTTNNSNNDANNSNSAPNEGDNVGGPDSITSDKGGDETPTVSPTFATTTASITTTVTTTISTTTAAASTTTESPVTTANSGDTNIKKGDNPTPNVVSKDENGIIISPSAEDPTQSNSNQGSEGPASGSLNTNNPLQEGSTENSGANSGGGSSSSGSDSGGNSGGAIDGSNTNTEGASGNTGGSSGNANVEPANNNNNNNKNNIDTNNNNNNHVENQDKSCYVTNRIKYPDMNMDVWCTQNCPGIGKTMCFYQTCMPVACPSTTITNNIHDGSNNNILIDLINSPSFHPSTHYNPSPYNPNAFYHPNTGTNPRLEVSPLNPYSHIHNYNTNGYSSYGTRSNTQNRYGNYGNAKTNNPFLTRNWQYHNSPRVRISYQPSRSSFGNFNSNQNLNRNYYPGESPLEPYSHSMQGTGNNNYYQRFAQGEVSPLNPYSHTTQRHHSPRNVRVYDVSQNLKLSQPQQQQLFHQQQQQQLQKRSHSLEQQREYLWPHEIHEGNAHAQGGYRTSLANQQFGSNPVTTYTRNRNGYNYQNGNNNNNNNNNRFDSRLLWALMLSGDGLEL